MVSVNVQPDGGLSQGRVFTVAANTQVSIFGFYIKYFKGFVSSIRKDPVSSVRSL